VERDTYELVQRFTEDLTWLPSDDEFDRYPDGTDLGIVLTDERHDIRVFERLDQVAHDLVDSVRRRPGTVTPDRLLPDLPLLVVSRRGSLVAFAALQSWDDVAHLIEQDLPRALLGRAPGRQPAAGDDRAAAHGAQRAMGPSRP